VATTTAQRQQSSEQQQGQKPQKEQSWLEWMGLSSPSDEPSYVNGVDSSSLL